MPTVKPAAAPVGGPGAAAGPVGRRPEAGGVIRPAYPVARKKELVHVSSALGV